jgi:zinc transporter 9
MTLSSSQLRLISTIGMGVLVGTSLIVIIPEGIEAIYTAGSTGHLHSRRNTQFWGNGIDADLAPAVAISYRTEDHMHAPRIVEDINILERYQAPDVPVTTETSSTSTTIPKETSSPSKGEEVPPVEKEEEAHGKEPPTFYIGLSLILGFILMFLIDKLPRHASENLQPAPPTRHISLDNLSQGLHSSSDLSIEDEDESFLQSLAPTPKQSRSLATTTGLVIHAAADGIAMGASASSANTSLGFIVFVAILVHKAPAAFGLTSVLLKQGLSKRAARGHLIIFSLASPVGAITTFFLVNILGGGHIAGEKGQWWTGMLLLFSAGTFL